MATSIDAPEHLPCNGRLTRTDGIAAWRGRKLPAGPWHAEPDREELRSPSGLSCLILRGPLGAWCGYVAVPPGHPWHGRDYGEITADVHGGLTYSERCSGAICHVPAPGEPDDVWWLGFDCNHSGDLSLFDIDEQAERGRSWRGGEYQTAEYVRAQTLSLAEQVHAAR